MTAYLAKDEKLHTDHDRHNWCHIHLAQIAASTSHPFVLFCWSLHYKMSLLNGDAQDFDEEEAADLQAELEEGFADIEQKWAFLPTRLIPHRYAVDAQQGFENVLVLDNIPIIDVSKKQRLVERLRQVFDKAGAGIGEDDIEMPWDDEAGTNKGWVCQVCFADT
jgi:hypothetical protein